jgi:Hg(II)-responsive transcriptional regulator
LTIGELAKQAAVGQETIRFYEREGLIPEPPRTASGYRQYPADTVARLRFILRAKELGFSLREIGELISLRLREYTCRADVREQASEKIRDLDAKIRDLQRMRSRLVDLQAACMNQGISDECPILQALQAEDKP